jgi:hypothetical protein
MKNQKKILKIKARIDECNIIFNKYGINSEYNIFIEKELNDFLKELNDLEKDIINEKR